MAVQNVENPPIVVATNILPPFQGEPTTLELDRAALGLTRASALWGQTVFSNLMEAGGKPASKRQCASNRFSVRCLILTTVDFFYLPCRDSYQGRQFIEMSPREAAMAASMLLVKYVIPTDYLPKTASWRVPSRRARRGSPGPRGLSERCGNDLVLQRYDLAAEPRIVSPPPDASPPRGPLSDAALASLS